MKLQVFTLLICLFISMVGFSQRNFKLTYDYKADKYDLFQEKKNLNRKTKEVNTKYITATDIKLKEGDIVKVEVINYNPLKYKVSIEQKQIKYKPIMEPQVLGSVMSVFNQKTSILNFLGPEGVNIPQTGRDEEDKIIHFAEDYEKEEEYAVLLSDFNQHYKTVNEQLSIYNATIKDDLAKESLDKINVINTINTIRTELKALSVNELIAEGKKAQDLYKSAQVYKTNDDFIKKNKLTEDTEKEPLLEQYSDFNQSFQELGKIIGDLEALQANPNSRIDDEKLINLINTLENLEYVTEKTFVVHTNSNNNLRSTDPEGILTDLNFEVVVYDLQKVRDLSTEEEEEFTQYVKYPNDSLFIGVDGEITNKPCLSCESVLLAEGVVRGKEIPSIEEVMSGTCSSCLGKWIFYNEKGEISKIKSQPKSTVLTGKDENRTRTIKIDNPEQFETAVKVKKSLQMPVAGAVAMNWTTGVFGVAPFGGRMSYEQKSQNDSVQVIGTKLSPFALSLGTLMSIDFLSNRKIIPSINVGVAVDVLKTTNLNYLAGFSIRPKALPMLSFSGGLSYSLSSVLNDNISENTKYSFSDYQGLLNNQDFKKESYRFGYFLGMCVSF
jgi:hypothetical protein